MSGPGDDREWGTDPEELRDLPATGNPYAADAGAGEAADVLAADEDAYDDEHEDAYGDDEDDHEDDDELGDDEDDEELGDDAEDDDDDDEHPFIAGYAEGWGDDGGDDGGVPWDPGSGAPASGAGSGAGSGRTRSNRGTRLLVLLVLVGMLVAGVALERRQPEVTPARVTTRGLDGPEVPPGDAVSTAWYCAAGTSAAGGTTDETIYVANLSDKGITAEVTVDPGGEDPPRNARLKIEPYGRGSLAVSEVVQSASPGVVVEVAGGQAIVEHELRGNGDVAMSPCSHEPSHAWYFAAGGTPKGAAQVLELFNPFGDDAIVDIMFLTESGVQEPQQLQGFVVGRRSKVEVPITDLVERQDRVATVVRTRTGRVVAEEVRSFDGTDGRTGLALSLGAAAPRREWTLPVAAAASGADGSVGIANFGLTPTTVEVSMLLSGDGVLAPETVDVPSRSVVTFDPSDRIPAGTAYTLVVRSQGSVSVVAESLLTASAGAATSTGSSIAARRWALAGAPPGTSSAVIATNRGNAPVTVELRAYMAGDVNSPKSAPAIALQPGKTARFDLDEWGIDPDQVLVVEADGPIVVGRETYAGGESLALAVPFRG